jgi:hypothetical protein
MKVLQSQEHQHHLRRPKHAIIAKYQYQSRLMLMLNISSSQLRYFGWIVQKCIESAQWLCYLSILIVVLSVLICPEKLKIRLGTPVQPDKLKSAQLLVPAVNR